MTPSQHDRLAPIRGRSKMSVAGLPAPGPVQGEPASVDAWERGWEQYLHYRGDPVAVMSEAGADDEAFVLGPVFAAVYRVLAGTPSGAPALVADTARARSRAGGSGDRERAHVRALEMLVVGESTAAARAWDEVANGERDFAAVRFAHDVYLHIGDDGGRLASSARAAEAWQGEQGWGFVAGQHAFALEEVGRYGEAEELGLAALGLDPDDLWARHALAHVYESTDDTAAALELLEGSVERWSAQDLFATHIWWHLALRLLASGDESGALAVFDERQPHATTAFQLCDQTSLLWRLELAGCEVGDRWDTLADCWDKVVERHTCAFLDLHAALAFVRRPDHPGAGRWWEGLHRRAGSLSGPGSENDKIFSDVVTPLAEAIGCYGRRDYDGFVRLVDSVGSSSRLIGGSIAQRDLISLTRTSATRTSATRTSATRTSATRTGGAGVVRDRASPAEAVP